MTRNKSEHIKYDIEDRCEKITESGCWIWMGSMDTQGYGQIRRGSRPGKLRYTHRVMSDAVEGKEAMHICDIPACCNPTHIVLGSHSDNMQDMIRKGRGVHKQPTGENSKMTMFKDSVIEAIKNSTTTRAETAKTYGCSTSLVAKVKRGIYRAK